MACPASGAAAAIGLLLVLSPLSAQAASAAVVNVPCNAATLATAISGAASGETLSLTPYCQYQIKAALPVVGQDLAIAGHWATLRRSHAPGTPAFAILSVDAGTLAVSDLNFSNGNGAISATENGSITVQGGTFSGNSAANGGAISSYTGAGNLTVTDATFSGNSATYAGGAIYTNEAAGNTTVTGSTFTKNKAGDIGGAIYNFFDMEVSASRFNANQATSGGAIFNNALGGDNLTGVTMYGNSATQDGGGIATFDTDLLLANSHIAGNHAGNEGGGIYQDESEGQIGLKLTSTTVQGNTAGTGGGVYNADDVAALTGSLVEGNQATTDGGGIYNDGVPLGFGTVNLGTTTVSGNKAGADGGGVYNEGGFGIVTATGSTITRNTAAVTGGGIYEAPSAGTVTLTSSPVQHNKPDNCSPPGSVTACTG
jgi:predicted outer membrane repeat protein